LGLNLMMTPKLDYLGQPLDLLPTGRCLQG
jgi:hypothetical protein